MRRSSLLALLLVAASARAGINAYDFNDPAQETRFRTLITELRCPKCQNQDIADSDAPLAKDLKDIIYDKVRAGEPDEKILAFMQQRYGDFILYRPPLKPSTWILWFGPILFLGGGALALLTFIRRRARAAQAEPVDRARLAALLQGSAEADSASAPAGPRPADQSRETP